MKKFIVVLIMSMFAVVAFAEDKTLTFAWDEPADLAKIKEWKIFIAEIAGGPYTEIAVVPKNDTFQAPATADIIGDPGTTETRFFVMIACGDNPVEAGGTEYACSANSNEISHNFWIPANEFSVPINFRIMAQ